MTQQPDADGHDEVVERLVADMEQFVSGLSAPFKKRLMMMVAEGNGHLDPADLAIIGATWVGLEEASESNAAHYREALERVMGISKKPEVEEANVVDLPPSSFTVNEIKSEEGKSDEQ